MQENIRGIVLRTVKYGDKSLIVDLFTESHGRQSFMASVVHTKRSPRTISLWQPLSMIEITADLRPSAGRLPHPHDVRIYYNYVELPFSPIKSTLALFLAEFLCAALREEKENPPLYQYIQSSLQWLDLAANSATAKNGSMERHSKSIANFHIVFLMHLTRFLGIYPNVESPTDCFDLLAGSYCGSKPTHNYVLRDEEARALTRLLRMEYANMHHFRFSRSQRQRILHVLNDYYRLHIPCFPELKSLDVLNELFTM